MLTDTPKKYHIDLTAADCGNIAILPGDPGRVETIARFLDEPHFVASKREYTTWTGYRNNKKITVTSTGIGGPSAAIAVHELAECGAETFIRVGTCGAMQLSVMSGDIIVATGSIRGDGTTPEYLPLEFPAVPDFTVLTALAAAAKSNSENADGKRYHMGIVQSKDSFYSETEPEKRPVAEHLLARWQAYIRGGCLASEMESSTLFIVAQTLGLRAGAIFTSVWNVERHKAGLADTVYSGSERAIKTAVEAAGVL